MVPPSTKFIQFPKIEPAIMRPSILRHYYYTPTQDYSNHCGLSVCRALTELARCPNNWLECDGRLTNDQLDDQSIEACVMEHGTFLARCKIKNIAHKDKAVLCLVGTPLHPCHLALVPMRLAKKLQTLHPFEHHVARKTVKKWKPIISPRSKQRRPYRAVLILFLKQGKIIFHFHCLRKGV